MLDPLILFMPIYVPVALFFLLKVELDRSPDESVWPNAVIVVLAMPMIWGLHLAIAFFVFSLNGGSYPRNGMRALQGSALLGAAVIVVLIYSAAAYWRKRSGRRSDP